MFRNAKDFFRLDLCVQMTIRSLFVFTKDTVINLTPNADISKKHENNFFLNKT